MITLISFIKQFSSHVKPSPWAFFPSGQCVGQLLVRELQLLLPYSNDTLGNMIHDDAMIKMIPGECMTFPMSVYKWDSR